MKYRDVPSGSNEAFRINGGGAHVGRQENTRELKLLKPIDLFRKPQSIIKRTRQDLIVTQETTVGCGGEEKENTESIIIMNK